MRSVVYKTEQFEATLWDLGSGGFFNKLEIVNTSEGRLIHEEMNNYLLSRIFTEIDNGNLNDFHFYCDNIYREKFDLIYIEGSAYSNRIKIGWNQYSNYYTADWEDTDDQVPFDLYEVNGRTIEECKDNLKEAIQDHIRCAQTLLKELK